MSVHFGKKIKEIRKNNSLTQLEFAEIFGYKDKSMIAHIEKGETEMSNDKIALLIERFNVDANELFIEKKNSNDQNYVKRIRRYLGSQKIILNCAGGIVEKDGKILFQHRTDNNKDIVIREMQEDDLDIFVKEELSQGWHSDRSKFLVRLKDQSNGKCISLTVLYEGQPVGYVSVYINGLDDYINKKRVPEIVDIAVLEKYRNQGIGSLLMDISEEVAKHYSDEVWLAVGLHSGYGSAQRMYIKRGYVPDGTGIWYQGKQCKQYEQGIANDDDLVLFLNKKLKQ